MNYVDQDVRTLKNPLKWWKNKYASLIALLWKDIKDCVLQIIMEIEQMKKFKIKFSQIFWMILLILLIILILMIVQVLF